LSYLGNESLERRKKREYKKVNLDKFMNFSQ